MPTTTAINISLSSFGPFLVADAQSQATVVKQTRERYEQAYSPPPDYWRQWRKGLITTFTRRQELRLLSNFIPDHDPKRSNNYERASKGVEKWGRRLDIEYLGRPGAKRWEYQDMGIRLNPELALRIDGQVALVKLYLKSDDKSRLNKRTADPLLQLLHDAYHDEAAEIIILDACAGKAFKASARRSPGRLRRSLIGRAASFQAMWRDLD